ncbi:hypothetical protein MTO96_010859 [Rhipicephalus appendiculatus]
MFKPSSTCTGAPVYSPASRAGTCNVQYPEVQAPVIKPVVLMNSEDVYVIVVALVVSTSGYICALTHYFADDSMLKRNDEETRQYTAAFHGNAKAADGARQRTASCCCWWHEGRRPALETASAASWPVSSGRLRCRGFRAVVSELRAQDNMPVVLMNREGLYVIIAVLGVSTPGMRLRAYVLLRQLQQAEAER